MKELISKLMENEWGVISFIAGISFGVIPLWIFLMAYFGLGQ